MELEEEEAGSGEEAEGRWVGHKLWASGSG